MSFADKRFSLLSGERGEGSAVWNVDAPQGKYIAKAVVRYDGEKREIEKEFEIGEFVLDLKHIFVEDFVLGGIAKFNMIVENKWNEMIRSAYAEMRVYGNNFDELANLKSATYDIPAGEQTTMVYHWDTAGIEKGMYDANVILHYGGKKTQQDLQLDVQQDRINVIGLGYVISEAESGMSNTLLVVLVTVIGVLVIMNVLWFLVFRKRLKKK